MKRQQLEVQKKVDYVKTGVVWTLFGAFGGPAGMVAGAKAGALIGGGTSLAKSVMS